MAAILYARVSTAEQTIEHQLAHARSAGFTIDDVISDNGVSGVSTRLVDPEGRSVRQAAGRRRACSALARSPRPQLCGRGRHDQGIHAPRRRGPHSHQQHSVRQCHDRSHAMRRPGCANSLHGCDGTGTGGSHEGRSAGRNRARQTTTSADWPPSWPRKRDRPTARTVRRCGFQLRRARNRALRRACGRRRRRGAVR
jgi:Resolvase, N terminal domain